MRALRFPDRGEVGFSLVELLVVMIIIGILAAIAIPFFLNQRQKTRDTATKSDVSRLGKEVAAYYVEGTGALSVTTSGSDAVLQDGGSHTVATVPLTPGTELQTVPFAATSGSESTTWCVALQNPDGDQQTYHYSAAGGLGTGACP